MAHYMSERDMRKMRRDARRDQILNEERHRVVSQQFEGDIADSTPRIHQFSEYHECDTDISTYNVTDKGDMNSFKTIDQCGGSLDISKEIIELDRKLSVLKQTGTEALIKARASPFTNVSSVNAFRYGKNATIEKQDSELKWQKERQCIGNMNNVQNVIEIDKSRRSSYLESTRKDIESELHMQETRQPPNSKVMKADTDVRSRIDSYREISQKEQYQLKNIDLEERSDRGSYTDMSQRGVREHRIGMFSKSSNTYDRKLSTRNVCEDGDFPKIRDVNDREVNYSRQIYNDGFRERSTESGKLNRAIPVDYDIKAYIRALEADKQRANMDRPYIENDTKIECKRYDATDGIEGIDDNGTLDADLKRNTERCKNQNGLIDEMDTDGIEGTDYNEVLDDNLKQKIEMVKNRDGPVDEMDRWTKSIKLEREKIDSEIEREKDFIHQLRYRNRMMDNEMKIRDKEERQLTDKINALRMAQQELDNVRKERESMENDIKHKLEYESLREKKIQMMKLIDQELSENIVNGKLGYQGESIDRNKGTTAQSPAGFSIPRIPPFLGIDYTVWKIEVDFIIQSGLYPEVLISQALRSALKGETKRILLTLNPMASSDEILKKLEDIYGTTQIEDSIMQELFNAKQRENETTSDWALRLESIVQFAVQSGEITENKRNGLLKQRFWKGLRNEKLRNNTRVTYESEASFERLRKKAKMEEFDLNRCSEGTSKSSGGPFESGSRRIELTTQSSEGFAQKQDSMNKQLDLLHTMMGKMEKLELEMAELRKDRRDSESTSKNNDGFRKGFNYNRNYPKKEDGKKDYQDKDGKQNGDPKNLNA